MCKVSSGVETKYLPVKAPLVCLFACWCVVLFRLDDGRLSPASVPLGAAAIRDLDDSFYSPSFIIRSFTTWIALILLATHTRSAQPRQWVV